MPYWLTNPDHGVMPVYDMGDVERNKVHGWELLNQGPEPMRKVPAAAFEVMPVAKPDLDQAVANLARDIEAEMMDRASAAPVKRKPGRPPKVK